MRCLVIACKKDEKDEFQVPIFAVYNEASNILGYVDHMGRVYKDWKDWKTNNTLPMLKYGYPTNGYFSCDPYSHKFDMSKEPCVTFDNSPNCSVCQEGWATG